MLKNLPRPLFAIVWVLFCVTPMFAQLSAEHLDKLSAYHYQSVDFSTTEQQLLQSLPEAKLEPTHKGSELGVRTYEYRENLEGECVLFRYFENLLVEIDIIYFPSKVAACGGAPTLMQEAVKRFGQPMLQENDTLLWDFPSIDRMVVISLENGNWSLHVYHRARRLAIPEYKDTSAAPRSAQITVTEGFVVPYESQNTPSVPRKSRIVVSEGFAIPQQPTDMSSVPKSEMAPIKQQARMDYLPLLVPLLALLILLLLLPLLLRLLMAIIAQRARKNPPPNLSSRGYLGGKQDVAYQEFKRLKCPANVPQLIFKILSHKIAQDYGSDHATQLDVLKKQISDYLELENMATPEGMAGSHFLAFRNSAASRHPYDYSTQLYVLRQYINDYQASQQTGNSGEAITDFAPV